MKIKNIDDVKISINRSVVVIFLVIFLASNGVLLTMHARYANNQRLLNAHKIQSVIDTYKSNLSEKISIIASSTIFLDYLHSGENSRIRLYPEFFSQVESLRSKSVIGIEILDDHENIIFHSGNKSQSMVELSLCYLNQNLNSTMGNCRYSSILYLSSAKLFEELSAINSDIVISPIYDSVEIISGNLFGSFPIIRSSGLSLRMGITNKKDHVFLCYFILTFVTFLIFAIWNWYRISSLLKKFIANPVQHMAFCLQKNVSISSDPDKILEIQYLTNEINNWKSRIAGIQEQEKAVSMGLLAAQLAHDIRSPLSVMEISLFMLEKNMSKESATILRSAIQNIRDIADDLLSRYRSGITQSSDENLLPIAPNQEKSFHAVYPLLNHIVTQKKQEWAGKNCELTLTAPSTNTDILLDVSPNQFRRMMSNLLNNAFESCREKAKIRISVTQNHKSIDLLITDNGMGIPPEKIKHYLSGGSSKHAGKGMGLSGSVLYMDSIGGKLTLKSRDGQGTDINLKFPLPSSLHC